MAAPIRRYTIHAPQLEGRPWSEVAQELQRFLRYLMSANDSGQEGAGIVGVVDGSIDHGNLPGLLDDDHTQYLKEKASGGTAGEIPLHTHTSGAQAGQLDHGLALAGLTDDDHTQYLKEKLSGGLAIEVPAHTHADANNAGQVDHGAASEATSLLDNDHPLYQRKHGFDLGSDGAPTQTITYDKTTRKITITPTGATFRFWIDGVQFIKTGAQVLGTAHGTTTGKYFIYYDSAGVLQVGAVEAAWSIRDRTVTPVAIVYWNNTLADGICFYECHTADRILEFHYRDHFALGTQYISGGDLTGYTPSTDTDAAVTYAIGSGFISDEDIRFEFGNVADGGPYVVFYRTGASGEWTWDATPVFPFLRGATYPSWNNPNGGGAGVWGMTETSGGAGGTWVNYFVCATSAVTPAAASGFLVPGQASHTSLAAAQAEFLSSLSLGTLPFEEVRGIWRVTLFARSTLGGTTKSQIVQVTKITSQTVTVAGGAGGVTDHGALTGLADDDHTQYLDATRHAAIDAADHGSGAAADGLVLTADGAGGAAWEASAGGGGAAVYRFAITDPPAGDELYPFMVAPVAGNIVKVSCILVGTGSADVNVELEAAEILGADLTVTTSWSDSGALTEAVVAGDEIAISLKNVVSPVGYIVVQIDFEAS